MHYSRGFASRLTIPAAAFAQFGAALLEAAPVEVVVVPDAVGGSTRVTVRPPGEDRCWRAYFSRSEDAGDFDTGGWRTRGELAAGISAVVAPLPRRPGTAG